MVQTVAQKSCVLTELPGRRSQELLQRQEQRESAARTYPRSIPVALQRAQGAYVEDVDGNIFIDFLSGAATLALGHNHPEVVRAVGRQLGELVHTLDFPTPLRDEFTSVQLALLPPTMRDRMKIQFCGGAGADAVDAALKLCKAATGRSTIISFHGSFHGSTHGTLSVSGFRSRYPISGTVPNVHFLPYGASDGCPFGFTSTDCCTACIRCLDMALNDPLSGIELPAAVILEVVQGEAGTVVPRPRFIQEVRRITKDLGVPLIVDEIQSGCGRTGRWFAFEHFGIEPDVITVSKGVGGIGLPISFVLFDERLDAFESGAHTATFRGNQLAFAAGIATASIIGRPLFLGTVRTRGDLLRDRIEHLRERHSTVGAVRGIGLMLAFDIVDPHTGAPDGERAARAQREALRRGVILERGGRRGEAIRLLPPLIVSEETIEEAVVALDGALAAVED